MKAVFTWKLGPIPQFGDGEVEIASNGLYIKLPKELAKKTKLGHKKTAKGTAKDLGKAAVMTALFGPVGAATAMSTMKGEKVFIPFDIINDIKLTEKRFGILGKKPVIQLTLSAEGKTHELFFAPFEGTVLRKYIADKFYNELMPTYKKHKKRPSRKVTIEEEEVEEIEEAEEEEVIERPIRTRARKTKKERRIRFCPKCGNEVEPEDNFCTNCGYRLR